MVDQRYTNGGIEPPEPTNPSPSPIPRISILAVWALFLLSVGALVFSARGGHEWTLLGVLQVDGLTTVMWVVVTFFSGIVHSYSRRYMAGNRYLDRFYLRILAFTLVVMTMVAADHVALLAAMWIGMGLTMASLIGHEREWAQARAAARLARRYFLASSGLLAVGLAVLVWTTGETTITGILGTVESIPEEAGLVAVASIFLAAIIQSALFPFQKWLLSSMTAPTPASALMHAGFVNAGGILLTRFAPLFTDEGAVMSGIVVVGASSALLGQALQLVQPDIKGALGASTIAQMGFMILQCGLGFFAAAITHLVLHGFYKAYLFLSSGATVQQKVPKGKDRSSSGPAGLVVSLLTALGGGALFAVLTGKGTSLDSGLVLTLVVALTTLHATRDVLRRSNLTPSVRLLGLPLVVLAAISSYAVLFNGISTLLTDVPETTAPTELTIVHVAVAGLFVASYVVTELRLHRASKRLYVTLLNVSQPDPSTVLTRKEDYNDA